MLPFQIVNQSLFYFVNFIIAVGFYLSLLLQMSERSNSISFVNVDAWPIIKLAVASFLLSKYFSFGLM